MKKTILGFAVSVVGIVGCDVNVTVDGPGGEAPPAPPQAAGEGDDEGFSLQIPGLGVDVKSDEDGTTWKTPISEGAVKDGKVGVRAPGTDVNVDMQTGETSVRAPGTSVDVK